MSASSTKLDKISGIQYLILHKIRYPVPTIPLSAWRCLANLPRLLAGGNLTNRFDDDDDDDDDIYIIIITPADLVQ